VDLQCKIKQQLKEQKVKNKQLTNSDAFPVVYGVYFLLGDALLTHGWIFQGMEYYRQ